MTENAEALAKLLIRNFNEFPGGAGRAPAVV